MLTAEDNDFVTRVGPGTPMGTLMREYWLPAMLSSELPLPDCDPVRVMLLGEQLIGFRDTSGSVALIQNLCPHRGASLFLGRNEENGLRCIYHGWKFDALGRCVDMPNEPPESNFKNRVRATTYPTQERAGIVWAYLGPRETPPPLPLIEGTEVEKEGSHRTVAAMRSCNWLQGMEGDLDTTHSPFLHSGHVKLEDLEPGSYNYYRTRIKWAKFVAIDTDYGAMYGCSRPAGPDELYWRIAQFLFPCYTHTPGDQRCNTRMWVPMDDSHTMYYSLSPEGQTFGGPRSGTRGVAAAGSGQGWVLVPNTSGWYGRFNVVANAENDYLIDRDAQRNMEEFSGIRGIWTQDHAVTETMGPTLDRAVENLGSSDLMIIQIRRRLADAARALIEHKIVPPGVDDPAVYQTRSAETILPENADWLEATEERRRVPS